MSTHPAEEYDDVPDHPGPDHRAAPRGPAYWLTPARRRYLYAVTAAAMPVLIGYGLVADEQVAVVLNLVAALLGIGTGTVAAANTHPE